MTYKAYIMNEKTDTCPDCSNHPCDCGIPAGYTPTPRTDESDSCPACLGEWWRYVKESVKWENHDCPTCNENKQPTKTMNTPTLRTDDGGRYCTHQRRERWIKTVPLKTSEELQTELAAVTEQRDEARRLAEKYRYLSCDSQEEADETLLPWENNQTTEQ